MLVLVAGKDKFLGKQAELLLNDFHIYLVWTLEVSMN